jgi:hypothetical protein
MRLVFTIFAVFYMIVSNYGCATRKKMMEPLPINQGITGYVLEIKGNQMPSPDREPSRGHGFKTEVYAFEPTQISQVDRIGSTAEYSNIKRKLIKSVQTDASGRFAIQLPAGKYSLFTKSNGHYYANSFDAANNINIITVEPNKVTQVNITISSKAVY